MRQAVRAIIFDGDKALVMRRDKEGSQYYTLIGGRVADGEALEAALTREVKEETGLDITSTQLVFYEKHPAPYSEQYIYLCTVAPNGVAAIQETSEEGIMNRRGVNIHTLAWVYTGSFGRLPFRTPQLQDAIVHAIKKGFPKQPIRI